MKRKFIAVTLTTAATLLLAACTSGATPDETSASGDCEKPDTLNIIGIGIYADAVPILAEQQDIFASHCLTVEQKTVTDPPSGIAALAGGSADIAYVPSMPLINAVAKGLKLAVVAPADGYPKNTEKIGPERIDDTGVYVTADSGYKSPRDLVGKKVSVPAREAQIEITIASAIKKDGGDPNNVKWVQLDFPTALSQLDNQTIDAAGLASPFTDTAAQSGDKRLLSPGVEFFGPGATIGMWTTTQKNYDDKADAMQRFHDAIIEANARALDKPDEFREIVAKHTKVPVKDIKKANSYYYFSDKATLEDLKHPAQQMVDLGYLEKMPDFSKVIK